MLDRVTNERFDVRAKAVVFCGGPYTDALRKLGDEKAEDAVAGASGTHVVLPGYYCPRDQGLLDYNTSDGRFLFFLPWLGHTLVGTTDAPARTYAGGDHGRTVGRRDETNSPGRRSPVAAQRVLALPVAGRARVADGETRARPAMAGLAAPRARPARGARRAGLARPCNFPGPATNVVFAAGGKWTTWREMAEELVDEVCVDFDAEPALQPPRSASWAATAGSRRRQSSLSSMVASDRRSRTTWRAYGGRAWDVLALPNRQASATALWDPARRGRPYVEAEVRYACREHAVTIEDILSRRTRLAFLNAEAARDAVPNASRRS